MTYAVPQSQVAEVVRVAVGEDPSLVSTLSGSPTLRLRGDLVPPIDVTAVLGGRSRERVEPYVAVMAVAGRRMGLLVDAVRDISEIVVKPLGGALRKIPAHAGATVLGDGSVALILDINGLVTQGGVLYLDGAGQAQPAPAEPAPRDLRSYLLLQARDGGGMAVPLDVVLRLDEVAAEDVTWLGLLNAVGYRDEMLPLVDPEDVLPARSSQVRPDLRPRGRIPVVVCSGARGPVGLAVHEIADIAYDEVTVVGLGARDGVAETVMLRGRVTEVLDVDRLVELAEDRAGAA